MIEDKYGVTFYRESDRVHPPSLPTPLVDTVARPLAPGRYRNQTNRAQNVRTRIELALETPQEIKVRMEKAAERNRKSMVGAVTVHITPDRRHQTIRPDPTSDPTNVRSTERQARTARARAGVDKQTTPPRSSSWQSTTRQSRNGTERQILTLRRVQTNVRFYF